MLSPLQIITGTAKKIASKGRDFIQPQNVGGIIKNTITGIPLAAKSLVTGTGQFKADSKLGIARNTVTGLPVAARDVLAPTRGYTEKELLQAKPTLKQRAVAIPKVGAEIASGFGELANMIPGYSNTVNKIINNKAGDKLVTASQRFNQFSTPKNVEEASAMRVFDIASNFIPVAGTAKNLARSSKVIAATKDVKIITKELKALGFADDLVDSYAPRLVSITDEKKVSGALNNIVKLQAETKKTVGSKPTAALRDDFKTRVTENINNELNNLKSTDFLNAKGDIDDLETFGRLDKLRELNNKRRLSEAENREVIGLLRKTGREVIPNPSREMKEFLDITQNKTSSRTPIRGDAGKFKGSVKNTPTEAFGAVGGFEQDEEGKLTFNSTKAALGVAGIAGFTKGKKYFSKPEIVGLQTQLNITKEVLNNHPAKSLAKYANSNSELPEVLGGVKSKFGKSGDDIVTQLGFSDSESARRSYQDYLKGKQKVAELETVYKQALANKQAENLKLATQGPIKYSAEGVPMALSKRERQIVSSRTTNTATPLQEATKSRSQSPVKSPSVLSDDFVSRKVIDTPDVRSEMASLQQVAEQKLASQPNPEIFGKRSSLINMVEDMKTPVNKKVNALDYLRTPDRVLKKIGLEKESILVRQQYDKYLKELPENIDKISDWVKQVSEEGNVKIFKFLDGQEVKLNATEYKIAGEIKIWLKQWADRLGLPEDKRVTNYITRLFDDQLIAKEFDEDLAKLIRDKIPGSVYDPFLQKRLGALGYKEDTWAALDAYVKRATRKVHMDPALERLENAAVNLEDTQWNYVKKYADRINLRPTNIDNAVDNLIKSTVGYRFGQRPTMTLTQTLRKWTYRSMLGLNVGSALRNISQGVNTFAKLGAKDTMLGYAKLFSSAHRKELLESGILNNSFIQDRALSANKKIMEKIDKGLFVFFEQAEKINRGAAYFGAKGKAIKMGMNEADAIEYAKKIVRDTQFAFGAVDTPVAMQSDLVKTITQFQSFTLKQTEFLIEMAKNKEFAGLLRYGLGGAAFVYTIGQAFGMEEKELLPLFRFDTPASLKLPTEIFKAVVDAPNKYGQQRDLKEKGTDILNSFRGLIPANSQAKKTIEGIEAVKQGESQDKAGKRQFEVGGTPLKDAQAVVFGKYAGQSAKDYFNKKEGNEPKTEADKIIEAKKEKYDEDKKRINPIFIKAQGLVNTGKQEEANAIVSELSDEDFEIYKKIRSAYRAEKTREGVKTMLPIAIRNKKLKELGREAEALAEVDALSDEQYEWYKSAKEQLGY